MLQSILLHIVVKFILFLYNHISRVTFAFYFNVQLHCNFTKYFIMKRNEIFQKFEASSAKPNKSLFSDIGIVFESFHGDPPEEMSLCVPFLEIRIFETPPTPPTPMGSTIYKFTLSQSQLGPQLFQVHL